MRILQIAPIWETVPPTAYGGTEAVVYALVQELVRQGHEVTLCASGDSRTSATLLSTFPRSLRTAEDLKNKQPYLWHHAALSMREARQYDIIHNHAGEEVMALALLVPEVPMLTTMHCLITPDTKIIWDHYLGYYNTISRAQRRLMPEITGGIFAGVVYNAIDVASFPFEAEKGDYLLFLARICPEKAPHLAVEVARRTGRRLILAGKVDPVDFLYFTNSVAPFIDGENVVYVGEADWRLKRELYRRAYCVLMPVVWDEPFGLVSVEAMACGTPVIALNRGALREIVCHGRTGFVVDTVDQMVEAVRLVPEIDPWACREHVARHFDVPVMVDAYLQVYRDILRGRVLEPLVPMEVGERAGLSWTEPAAPSAQVA